MFALMVENVERLDDRTDSGIYGYLPNIRWRPHLPGQGYCQCPACQPRRPDALDNMRDMWNSQSQSRLTISRIAIGFFVFMCTRHRPYWIWASEPLLQELAGAKAKWLQTPSSAFWTARTELKIPERHCYSTKRV
ncbi:unnamed protein product [Fusarium graminearum]|nr:unnamed protein product [Fusarium graminearum]